MVEKLKSNKLLCRLCGRQFQKTSAIDIQEKHLQKINTILPIWIHAMDPLPKFMCHICNDKLDEFHSFYINCIKIDGELKSHLPYMQEVPSLDFKIPRPMVYLPDCKPTIIKIELKDDRCHKSCQTDDNSSSAHSNCRPSVSTNKVYPKINENNIKTTSIRQSNRIRRKIKSLSCASTDGEVGNKCARALRPRTTSVDYKTSRTKTKIEVIPREEIPLKRLQINLEPLQSIGLHSSVVLKRPEKIKNEPIRRQKNKLRVIRLKDLKVKLEKLNTASYRQQRLRNRL